MHTYTEKDILGDALASQKAATEHFNTFSNECVHDNLRDTMLQILDQEHSIQKNVFDMMYDKGYYPTPAAQESKVREARDQYAASVKAV